MKIKMLFLIVILLLVLTSLGFAQSKPDSTQFKYWLNELNHTQSRMVSLDSVKVKFQGIYEYQYSKALEEKEKLDALNVKKDVKK